MRARFDRVQSCLVALSFLACSGGDAPRRTAGQPPVLGVGAPPAGAVQPAEGLVPGEAVNVPQGDNVTVAPGGAPSSNGAEAPVVAGLAPGDTDGVEPFVAGQAPRALAHFRRGINLGNRLESKPDEGAWGGRIRDGDLQLIAERGFDHVRVPVWFSGHAGEAEPFALDAAFLTRVDEVLDLAARQGLAVVLTLHGYYELEADVAGHRPRLLGLWSQLSEHYRERPDTWPSSCSTNRRR